MMTRRHMIKLGLSSVPVALASPLSLIPYPAAALPKIKPSLGMHLPLWHQGDLNPASFWNEVFDDLQSIGINHYLLLTYCFTNPQTGQISEQSRFNTNSAPDLDFIEQGLANATKRGMKGALYPVLEIDNDRQIGEIWRGFLNFSGAPLESFFTQYMSHIENIAGVASKYNAERVYLGSELRSLTHNQATLPYWEELIHKLRDKISNERSGRESNNSHWRPPLTYAAHWEEYKSVTFWQQLDEIAINAYFPLSTEKQAEGKNRPAENLLQQNLRKELKAVEAFSKLHKRPVLLSEFGLTGYDKTTTAPWSHQSSEALDPGEQLNGYRALLEEISDKGSWLKAIHIWHWQPPGRAGSGYNLNIENPVTTDLRTYITSSGG